MTDKPVKRTGPSVRSMSARLARSLTGNSRSKTNPVLDPLLSLHRKFHPKADAELLDRSVSVAAKLLAEVDEPVGTAERREVVESKWKALDMDRRRMLVDELVTVTIEPIAPGHVKFDPDLIRIEPRRD